jgi:hypothetical protein
MYECLVCSNPRLLGGAYCKEDEEAIKELGWDFPTNESVLIIP